MPRKNLQPDTRNPYRIKKINDNFTEVYERLDSIETGSVIKALYEAEPDTNAYTDAEKAKLGSSVLPTRVTVTTNHTAVDYQLVICDMSVGDITVDLPTSSTYGVTVKRSGVSNTLLVDPGAGRTINGEASLEILYDGSAVQLRFDGTSNWEVV